MNHYSSYYAPTLAMTGNSTSSGGFEMAPLDVLAPAAVTLAAAVFIAWNVT